jgi:Domain of unknown function (DUF1929)
MRAVADVSHGRIRAALGAVFILGATIAGPWASGPPAAGEAPPPPPFLSNGKDDGFAIAMSQEQGPVFDEAAVTTAAVPATGDPVRGTFGGQVAWPIIPIHAVLMPDGRVLTYGSDRTGAQTGMYDYDVWDPRAGTGLSAHMTLPNQTATDLFCSAQIVLVNGNVELYGGDQLPAETNSWNHDVNQFRPGTNTLVRTTSMQRERWYATATMLPNAEVFIQGGSGGEDFPEVRTTTGEFRLLTGAPTDHLSSGYPKNFVAPDGLVFGLAGWSMYRVDPSGTGSITDLGGFPGDNSGATSTSVMFAPGRILQVGGGGVDASRNASIIDINGSVPDVRPLPQTQFGRHWGNATVMADGRVLVSGGSAVNNEAIGVAHAAEIFNPATNTWTPADSAVRMRLYHSTSLLLPDATVITMGGGAPGPETNLNAEIYYPPYLFDRAGNRAPRPTISSATPIANPGTTLTIESPDAAAVSRVSLVKVGSVTHSFDMDQRFQQLPFTRSGTTLRATLPANVNRTPPGYYMVFVIRAGVPSVAKFVRINVAGSPLPPPPPPPPAPARIVNGSFENNPLVPGQVRTVRNLAGWTSRNSGIKVWRRVAGAPASHGTSFIEVDRSGTGNRTAQSITTQRGHRYRLSLKQSPRPGISSQSNRFTVYWNGTRLATISRGGRGLSRPSWRTSTFTVTGTGRDWISFRERDDNRFGAFVDDVRLVAL